MIRVNVICEGQTEENFISKILYRYLQPKNIFLTPRNIGKGDSYDKFKFNIVQWLRTDPKAWVTSMIDLYGMNKRFPGFEDAKGLQPNSRVLAVESAIQKDIEKSIGDSGKFIPYVQLHEFETLLFANPEIMERWLSLDGRIPKGAFRKILSGFENPEYINDDPNTSPSKRILEIIPGYSKTVDGKLILDDIGVDKIREECPHFHDWVMKLESLAAG